MTPGATDVDARLARLEGSLRNWRRAGLGALLLLVAAGVTAAAGDDPEVLRAKRLELRDDAGKVRAVLGLGSNGEPELSLNGSDGRSGLAAHLSGKEGARIVFREASGRTRIQIGTYDDGTASVRLSDRRGRDRAVLAFDESAIGGVGAVVIRDHLGDIVAKLPE